MSDFTVVRYASQLQAGDHISWPTRMSAGMLSHHAIVVAPQGGNEFKIIHARMNFRGQAGYNSSGCGRQTSGRTGGSGISVPYVVIEEVRDFSKEMQKWTLLRYCYEPNECNEPFEVIQNARNKLGNFKFHPLDNNCEHFARRCKTGNRVSYQADSIADSSLSASAAYSLIESGSL